MNEEISASDFILAQRIRAVLQVKMDAVFNHVTFWPRLRCL